MVIPLNGHFSPVDLGRFNRSGSYLFLNERKCPIKVFKIQMFWAAHLFDHPAHDWRRIFVRIRLKPDAKDKRFGVG